MAAPTISISTTGSDPRSATLEELESDVNGALATLFNGLNGYFVAFYENPVLDVGAGVIRYGAGYFRRKDGGANVLFDPQDIGLSSYEVPISGSVSGAVMHYLDTSVDPTSQNPIVALSRGNVIGVDSSLIPLGIWLRNRWTPIMGGQLHDIRTPNADYATWFVRRPIVVDLDDTLDNGGPTVYVPRDLWISRTGTTSVGLTAANALSDRLPGNYCAISVTKSALADNGPGQTLYWDFADHTVKRAVHPDAPATVGRNGYLLLLTLTGQEGIWTSPIGLPVRSLHPLRGEEILADLVDSLVKKNRSTHLVLVGDSATWGLTASDNGPLQPPPRTHQLTDRRDIITSSSWANKLRRWAASMACGARNETEPAPGESLHRHTVDMAPYSDPNFTVMDASNQVLPKAGLQNRNGPLLKSHLDIPAGAGNQCVFKFTGTEFTVFFTKINAAEDWSIWVDDVEILQVDSGPVAWSQQRTVQGLDFGEHRVRLVNNSASRFLRLEALRFTKSLRFSNNGLIGTNTEQWLPGGTLLEGGVPTTATHVMIQLGGNDRGQDAEATLPEGELRTSINLRHIVNWLKSNRPGVPIILMAVHMIANDEQSDSETFHSSSDDLMREIRQLAEELEVGFIDNYSCTLLENIDGTTFLADRIHQNDHGHTIVYRNIVRELTSARR